MLNPQCLLLPIFLPKRLNPALDFTPYPITFVSLFKRKVEFH